VLPVKKSAHAGQGARPLALACCCLLLSACSLSPWRVEQVDSRVSNARQTSLSCEAEEIDRCSANSPLLALARENVKTGVHHLTLLDVGEDALKIRIHLIRAAQNEIKIQNFILRKDDTGELILNELLNAARRGVKVSLLLDQMFSFSDIEYLVMLTMAHTNFKIKFYNPTFNKAKMARRDWISAVACCFRRFNQRMHNKLLVVDELVGVIGGRNIADRYFDFDTNYNFKDRDVAIYGATAREMSRSFDEFWESPKSVKVQYLRDVAKVMLNGGSTDLPPYEPNPRLQVLLDQITDENHIRSLFIEPAFQVERVAYFSDQPLKTENPDKAAAHDITLELHSALLQAQESVVIQSPYMVLSRKARKLFVELRQRNPEIELVFSSNSLAATDADTVYANTHKHKKRYVKKLGFRMYEFKPFPLDAPDFFPRWPHLIEEKKRGVTSKSTVSGDDSTIAMPAPRIGLHSKSFVVDGKVAMIGSHNFDPRSEGFNTENGLIVWDEPFARTVEQLIRRDTKPQNSWIVAMKPGAAEVGQVHENPSVKDKVKYDSRWYGSTSAFELIPGKQPVPPESPLFYQNHYSVGSFPEVIKTRRQITVLFLGSFFGFLEPIL
jgi:putative cardiolipin synthase